MKGCSSSHSVVTIIHYCTNDYRFLRKSVDEAKLFSQEVIIPICDHFFDGTQEDRSLLHKTYEAFPECQFIEFQYDPVKIYHPYQTAEPNDWHWVRYWHSTSRYIGALFAPEAEYLLFLDADEIIDGKRFLQWLNLGTYRKWDMMSLEAYLYVHKASLQAKKTHPYSILMRPPREDLLALLNVYERYGYFHYAFPGVKKEGVADEEGKPFIHHYTWVRSKQECLRKATSWGLRFDKDWVSLIEKMDENLMDFDTGFVETTPFFDPLVVEIPQGKSRCSLFDNVLRVDLKTIREKEIKRLL